MGLGSQAAPSGAGTVHQVLDHQTGGLIGRQLPYRHDRTQHPPTLATESAGSTSTPNCCANWGSRGCCWAQSSFVSDMNQVARIVSARWCSQARYCWARNSSQPIWDLLSWLVRSKVPLALQPSQPLQGSRSRGVAQGVAQVSIPLPTDHQPLLGHLLGSHGPYPPSGKRVDQLTPLGGAHPVARKAGLFPTGHRLRRQGLFLAHYLFPGEGFPPPLGRRHGCPALWLVHIDPRVLGHIRHVDHTGLVHLLPEPSRPTVQVVAAHRLEGQPTGHRPLDHLPAQLHLGLEAAPRRHTQPLARWAIEPEGDDLPGGATRARVSGSDVSRRAVPLGPLCGEGYPLTTAHPVFSMRTESYGTARTPY